MRRGVKQSTKANGHIRVISGLWRGRKIPVLNAEGLRPTTDRTKETLFNWLAPYVSESRCLDAFSGSGSLGIEALSRYASYCAFYEKEKSACQQIRSNLELLKVENDSYAVYHGDSLQLLQTQTPNVPFDIIFIDPPFNKGLVDKVIPIIDSKQLLSSEGLVYIETELAGTNYLVPDSWSLIKESQTKQLCYRLYQKG